MTGVILGAIYFVVVLVGCVGLGYAVTRGSDRDQAEAVRSKGPYQNLKIPYVQISAVIVFLVVIRLPGLGFRRTLEWIVAVGFGIVLSISLYYVLLGVMLKPLRARLNARRCAMLWFVPAYLIVLAGFDAPAVEPWVVLPWSDALLWTVVLIWLGGTVCVWLWKVAEDIRFRRQIMTGAKFAADPGILAIWREEVEKAGLDTEPERSRLTQGNQKAPRGKVLQRFVNWIQPEPMTDNTDCISPPEDILVFSPHVKTPLTVGGSGILSTWFFLRIVLPEQEYTKEEIRLILRHELVHILHDDCKNKRFLVFCRALCWFNPLVWMAMRRSAEDLERFCDEAVLQDEQLQTRKQYAQLILQTAGDERGFTTCLSASAQSLRYRLKSIMKPGKKTNGMWALVLAFVLLLVSFGPVTVGFGPTTGEQAIFIGKEAAAFEISSVHLSGEQDGYYECTFEEALTRYLAQLPMSRVTGKDYLSIEKTELTIVYYGPEGSFGITIRGRILTVTPMQEDARGDARFHPTYYLSQDVDWEYIRSLLK